MRKGILPAIPVLALFVVMFAAACGGDGDEEPLPTSEPTSQETAPRTRTATTSTSTATTAASPTAGDTATTEPTPQPNFEPFPARRADGQAQTDRCGSFTILREAGESASDNFPRADRVTISNEQGVLITELINDEPFTMINVDWCFDLNGDGQPELSVSDYSGGAHCCTSQVIYTFNAGKIEPYLLFEAGNAGPLLPQELDGAAPIELTGFDDRFAYYDDLAYAVSPTLVIVYAYEDGEHVEATKDFPDVVRQYRNQLTALYQTCGSTDAAIDCQKGVGLGIMAESLLLGDWDDFAATLAIPGEVRAWLETNRADIEAILAARKPSSP